MFVDAGEIGEGSQLETELCIVGTGAAGLSLSLEFVGTKTSVLLLESGGLSYEDATQSLYEGSARRTFDNGDVVEDIGDSSAYLKTSRLRYYGGTTNQWAGVCRPLDDLDFEVRSWVSYSGWPISRDDLEPYYQRANRVMSLKPFVRPASGEGETYRGLYGSQELADFSYQWFHTRALRFGQVYRQTLEDARNMKVLFHANVVKLRSNGSGTALAGLDVMTLAGKRLKVQAKAYVLACGGIENPRLLLASQDVYSEGIGNAHDIVGRYFMEHPHASLGHVCLPSDSGGRRQLDGIQDEKTSNYLVPAICPTEAAQRKHGTLNFSAEIRDAWNDFGHWSNLSRNLAWYTQDIHRFAGRYSKWSDDPSENQGFYRVLYVRAEQAPNPNSRVTLTRERDPLGIPKVFLDWQLTRADVESLRRTAELFAQDLGRAFLGRVRLAVDLDNLESIRVGNHHMGTTRMAGSPRSGVVDRNCKVFGLANLYVAGSSVFSTGGFANPTYTIVALALRLADHLNNYFLKA